MVSLTSTTYLPGGFGGIDVLFGIVIFGFMIVLGILWVVGTLTEAKRRIKGRDNRRKGNFGNTRRPD